MNRTGFVPKEVIKILNYVEKQKEFVDVKGICSHLAGAESISNYKRITDQKKKFKNVRKRVKELDLFNPTYHLASSAATSASRR